MSTPNGYMKNAQGHLVPVEQVRPSDLMRDTLVNELVARAGGLNQQLTDFKRQALQDVDAYVSLVGEKYGVQLGGKQGNVSLLSYDGRYKIERIHAKNIGFTAELQAAKALIEQCIMRWSADARSELKALIMQAFRPNSKGELRTSALLGLLRLEIEDEDWLRAMQALKDSIQVNGCTTYIRLYERIGMTDQYKLIPLDIAGVAV
jgi:hypothetical protein